MKKTLVLLATVGLVAVGCERSDSTMNESAGAEQQIEAQKDAQVEQLEAQKDQLGEEAEAKQEAIEAQADAKQAQLDAEAEQVKAQAAADKAQLEAQEQTAEAQQQAQEQTAEAQADAAAVQQEAAGAAAPSDQELEKSVRTSLLGDESAQPQATAATQNVQIQVTGGKVTLSGTVKTEQEKQDMETKAKAIQGVKEVENNIEVKAE